MPKEVFHYSENERITTLSFNHRATESHFQTTTSIPDAVHIRKACKSYGTGKWTYPVLCDLNMTIPKGSIYGLLGASGCGKTTLLSCIVGQRSLDCGELLVFGEEPGTPQSGIPGRRVGHMPQELALCGEFTIKEAIAYFGMMYDLPPEYVKSQTKYLLKLLDLPSGSRRISNLSGGQQRRVSFAVAIFHRPELLILDEPTVGVDSILRQRIWNYLIQLNKDTGCTVIVTTHYLEEASQTNLVGIMRSGKILVEDCPRRLMSIHNLPNLEEVFLQLCIEDENNKTNRVESELNPPLDTVKKGENENGFSMIWTSNNIQNCGSMLTLPSINCLKALLFKDFTLACRNFWLIFIVFLFPCLSIMALFGSIGRDPISLRLAVVNNELKCNNLKNCENLTHYPSFSMLSCRYLYHLKNSTISQVHFENIEDATKAARNGEIWGVIQFSGNFSENLVDRITRGVNDANLETIIDSQIGINLDESNHLIKSVIQETAVEAFSKLFEEMQKVWGYEPDATGNPIKFLDPMDGEEKLSFIEFFAPAVVVVLIFFHSLAQMSTFIVIERNQGLFHRSLIAGAKIKEMIMAHFAIQFIFMIGQIGMFYIFIIPIFKVYCKGNLALALFMTFLEGISGTCYGILVANLCSNLKQVLGVTVATNLSMLQYSGFMWPLEGTPVYWRNFVYFLPQTYAVLGLRNVFSRGWGLDHPDVLYGILSSFCWITCFSVVSILLIRKINA